MGEPCGKIQEIADLRAKNNALENALSGIRRALEENNKLLSSISEQGAEIRHLREDNTRNEKDIDALYNRVRLVEMAIDPKQVDALKKCIEELSKEINEIKSLPARRASKFFWALVTTISACLGATVSGLLVWALTKGAA